MGLVIVSTEVDGEYIDVGDLVYTAGAHGVDRVRFTYDADFVRRGWQIDPELKLDSAGHELRALPLAIEDASPDAWGERLLQRAERHDAKTHGRGERTLNQADFLIGSSDATRQGALRFRTEQDGAFLSDNVDVPKSIDIANLMNAAAEIDADPNTRDWAAFERLLGAGGGSLGGARPKAAIVGEDGRLWLAKFPRRDDINNVPVWEAVGLDIAERAGLEVPSRQLIQVAGREVLLLQRFDRNSDGRVHYMSARTLMGARDKTSTRDYGGRGGIASRLRSESPRAKDDLRRLWKQAALNLLINNTDNHLRNLGFLRVDGGWTLSPVFDLDPNPATGTEFATTTDGALYRISGVPGLMRMAKEFGMNEKQARETLDEVHQAVEGWDVDARQYGATETEIEMFEDAFTGLDDQVKRTVTPSGNGPTPKKVPGSKARDPKQSRVPRGVPQGGEYATSEHAESDVRLTEVDSAEDGDL